MNSIESSIWNYTSAIPFGVFRAAVGGPFDVFAIKNILERQTLQTIWKTTPLPYFWKGFQPNALKLGLRTPVQFALLKLTSSAIPANENRAVWGFFLGSITTVAEAILFNGLNSLKTRFIQGQGWSVLKQEGPRMLGNGFIASCCHRALSGGIFYAVYEPLKKEHPHHAVITSTLAAIVQVVSTAPFYIAAAERQSKNAVREPLHQTIHRLFKTHGFYQGLVYPGLIPRLGHSILITGIFMRWIEHNGYISR
jgi:hypothetical protein